MTKPPILLLFVSLLIATACSNGPDEQAAAPEWPGFRGDGRSVSSAVDTPVTWSEGSANVRWRTAIPGRGNSSPAVGGGQVFLTSAVKQTGADGVISVSQRVISVDLQSGELLWDVPIGVARAGKRHWLNTRAAPTPMVDGDRVYVFFGADLAALDFSGKILWKNEVDPTYIQFTRYGVASSPVIAGERVVVLQDREYPDQEKGWMGAFDRDTGEELWRTDWIDTCCAYTTPTILDTADGGHRLLVALSARLSEYDLATGELLWSMPHKQYQIVSGLAYEDDIVCSTGGADHDRGTLCVRLPAAGEPEQLWIQRGGGAPEVASGVLYRGILYFTSEGGRMQAVDPLTGQRHWRGRLPSGQYHASLLAADGKIYAVSADGGVAVISAGNTFELLAYNLLLPGGGASPAMAGGCLLLRGENELACIEGGEGAAGEGAAGRGQAGETTAGEAEA